MKANLANTATTVSSAVKTGGSVFKKVASTCGKLIKYGVMAIGAYHVVDFAMDKINKNNKVHEASGESDKPRETITLGNGKGEDASEYDYT